MNVNNLNINIEQAYLSYQKEESKFINKIKDFISRISYFFVSTEEKQRIDYVASLVFSKLYVPKSIQSTFDQARFQRQLKFTMHNKILADKQVKELFNCINSHYLPSMNKFQHSFNNSLNDGNFKLILQAAEQKKNGLDSIRLSECEPLKKGIENYKKFLSQKDLDKKFVHEQELLNDKGLTGLVDKYQYLMNAVHITRNATDFCVMLYTDVINFIKNKGKETAADETWPTCIVLFALIGDSRMGTFHEQIKDYISQFESLPYKTQNGSISLKKGQLSYIRGMMESATIFLENPANYS